MEDTMLLEELFQDAADTMPDPLVPMNALFAVARARDRRQVMALSAVTAGALAIAGGAVIVRTQNGGPDRLVTGGPSPSDGGHIYEDRTRGYNNLDDLLY